MVCLWWYFWKILAFKFILSKEDLLLPKEVGIIQSIGGLNRIRKGQRKSEFSPLELRNPSTLALWAFGPQDLCQFPHHHHMPQFSGLWPNTGIYTICSPWFSTFRLRLNFATSAPGSLACSWQIMVFFIFHNHNWANLAPFTYLYLHTLLYFSQEHWLIQTLVPTWTFTDQGQPGYGHHWMPNLPAERPTLSSHYGTFPQIISHLPGNRLVIELLPSWKGQIAAIIATLDADLHFLHAMLLPKLLSVNLQNCLFPIMVFYTIFLRIKEFTSRHRKGGNAPLLKEFTTLGWIPPPSSRWLDRIVECLLKTQLQCQLGGNNLQGWVEPLQKAVYSLNQIQHMVLFL